MNLNKCFVDCVTKSLIEKEEKKISSTNAKKFFDVFLKHDRMHSFDENMNDSWMTQLELDDNFF